MIYDQLMHLQSIMGHRQYSSHAAVWPVIPRFEKPDGTRHYPVAAMVANLAKSTPEKPALMCHDDVVTFLYLLLIVFTDAIDYTKFWNELSESLSLVKSGKL